MGAKKLAQDSSKYWENPLNLGMTMINFLSVYGVKDFIVIKQHKGNKNIYWCLGIISVKIQRVW